MTEETLSEDDPSRSPAVLPNHAAPASPREAVLFSTSARKIQLFWPALAASLLTIWAAISSTESHGWENVGLMCVPPTILYAAVEAVRQRRATQSGHRIRLVVTAPLVLLAASIAYWMVLLALTRGSAIYAIFSMGPCLAIAGLVLGYAVPLGILGYVKLIDRRPLIGALLGLIGFGLVGAQFTAMAFEYRKFIAQPQPIALKCNDVTAAGVPSRQWVTLTGGMIPGIIRPQSHRAFPFSLFLGKIDHTDVALVDTETTKWIDLQFIGQNNGPSYWGPLREKYEGILTAPGDRLWKYEVPTELVKPLHGAPVGVLHVSATPSAARNRALLSFTLLVPAGWFTVHCFRRRLRRGGQRSAAA